MKQMNLNVRIKSDDQHPRGMIFTDAIPAGQLVEVSRYINNSTEPPKIELVVFRAGDGDETACTMHASDAALLGIDLDQFRAGDAPIDVIFVTYDIVKEKNKPVGGGIEPDLNRPVCLTSLAFDEAISNAKSYDEMVGIVVNQLCALGYSLGVNTFAEATYAKLKELEEKNNG